MALQLHRKETEWMAEYDGSVKALLGIIKYHEDETKQLKMEVKRLKAAAAVVPPSITRMARSTQTETLGSMKAAMRRNNVRFAKDEDDVATNKVERLSADAKTKASIARMQNGLGNPRQRIAQRDYRVLQSRCHRKHLKKDLEECNRVLHKRLAIQQKVLNQLLHTKLKAASSNTEQYNPMRSASPVNLTREAHDEQRTHPHKQRVRSNSAIVYKIQD
ncbi:uncharacterized protein PITG_20044 [Phytophthora infestans T30-4]|uniref:Uncharacterized protein n=1 Tax=Phytophthora infestans (strain T30-4) TaxID=403677 RepID=D0P145_PHYIT|nr:uncharacterized protein PITG_20044 [Phytophthora infestans T30-4]EEY53760.1 hypothetical protein PITG_20044 [Phytophthora infestans T30-4]|eukprot:XP_002895984.1 hypothetical protein PITG_20044 [Phytophthora infestans T30-4]